jgi:hypothetical protein
MSRKDYIAIAAVLRQTKDETKSVVGQRELRRVTNRIAFVFAKDNPLFDKERFMEASGFGGEDE